MGGNDDADGEVAGAVDFGIACPNAGKSGSVCDRTTVEFDVAVAHGFTSRIGSADVGFLT